jgi:hypothetical protein
MVERWVQVSATDVRLLPDERTVGLLVGPTGFQRRPLGDRQAVSG